MIIKVVRKDHKGKETRRLIECKGAFFSEVNDGGNKFTVVAEPSGVLTTYDRNDSTLVGVFAENDSGRTIDTFYRKQR